MLHVVPLFQHVDYRSLVGVTTLPQKNCISVKNACVVTYSIFNGGDYSIRKMNQQVIPSYDAWRSKYWSIFLGQQTHTICTLCWALHIVQRNVSSSGDDGMGSRLKGQVGGPLLLTTGQDRRNPHDYDMSVLRCWGCKYGDHVTQHLFLVVHATIYVYGWRGAWDPTTPHV